MTSRKTGISRRNPATFGSIERRGDRFRALYRRDGAVIRAPKTFGTRKEASVWLAAQATAQADGSWIDPRAGAETLRAYADTWLASRADLAPRTRANYRHSLDRWIFPDLGDDRLDAITPRRVREWYAEITRRAAQAHMGGGRRSGGHPARLWARTQQMPVPQTGRPSQALLEAWEAAGRPTPGRRQTDGSAAVAGAYRVLRTVTNAAHRDGLIARQVCQVVGAGQVHSPERTPATPEQIRALSAAMPERYQAAVVIAAWSGLRSGELRALARRHVDLDTGTLRVERAVIELKGEPRRFGSPKTRGSRRVVALPEFATEALRAHMEAFVPDDPDALVFGTSSGGILGTAHLSAAFRAAQERAGLGTALRWHDLRHTGASLAYAAGGGAPDVQRRLGHTTMRAAQIYAHAFESGDQALAARLNAMFGG